jgi:hypothetical protein
VASRRRESADRDDSEVVGRLAAPPDADGLCRLVEPVRSQGRSDLFDVARRELLDGLTIPVPWRGTVEASLSPIDDLDAEIDPSTAACA